MTVQDTKEVATQRRFSKKLERHRKNIMSLIPTVKPSPIFYTNSSFVICLGKKISFTTYRPYTIKNCLPTILYIPGTAFIANSPAYTHLICTHMAQKSNCQVIAISLPLAPEYQFPHNIYAGYSALKFLLNSPSAWTKIDLSKVALLGDSSGGNFATSMGILAKKDNLPITRLVLISPFLDLSLSIKGFEERYESKDKTIPISFLKWLRELYIPNGVKHDDPLLSPFWHNERELQSLPQTNIIVGEYDRFRGDAEKFYRKLLRANVSVNKLIVKKGDHSLWWQQISIAQAIARRIGISFNSVQHSDFTSPPTQSAVFSL